MGNVHVVLMKNTFKMHEYPCTLNVSFIKSTYTSLKLLIREHNINFHGEMSSSKGSNPAVAV